ncbi:unnamed protein product [Rotaria sp. Silwood1]|nr:unnamed protein product [Rotaria sp. Silwood1]CAF3477135.1 unnamed protein product [Rotaria sp. Silwood1]CAF3504197.1 unnamed protein product [Rotaria sp. Silwood1]CAF4995687.1 unnamed protein product [Rotaria sp. Silwood1]CAF5008946.1 unnamed protein product [Rotaria sp. Silwood1]
MSEIHKNTVQKFAQALKARQFNELDKYLEHYVEKLEHHQYVYKNIDEAREYYSKAPSAEWKVLEFQQLDTKNDTLTARVSHNKQIYHTTYTFSSAGKIEKIHSVPEHHYTGH